MSIKKGSSSLYFLINKLAYLLILFRWKCVLISSLFTMQLLKDDEPEKYQSHFSGLLKEGIEADGLADMYTKVHAAIRADPAAQPTEKKPPAQKRK